LNSSEYLIMVNHSVLATLTNRGQETTKPSADPAAQYVVRHDLATVERALSRNDYVRDMHEASGLLDLYRADDYSGIQSVAAIEEDLRTFLTDHDAVGSVVTGSSVDFDRKFLNVHMTDLNENWLHYRNIDVSTVKELARRFSPHIAQSTPKKYLEHRALGDIRESMEELRHYRDAGIFTAPEFQADCLAAS
jgi:oligoribonuclease